MESKDFIIKDGVLTEYRGKGGAVVIPEGVLAIGRYTFWNCIALTSIEMPSSVTAIGIGAFGGCVGLTSIHFSSSVTSIGEGALRGCTGVTSIEVSTDNPTYRSENNCIIERATNKLIAGCKTSIIPNGVTSIGEFAFVECVGLSSIHLSSSVTSIGEGAFYGCAGVTSIEVSTDNPAYRSENNCIIERATNKLIVGCKTSIIPSSVTYIGARAFQASSGLTSVEVPSGVTSIGMFAFSGCIGLKSIEMPSSLTSIGEGALRGCTGLTSITYMGTMAEWLAIGKHYDWDDCAGEYVVHCTDGDIGDANALYTYTGTGGDVVIPNGVTEIGEWAFADSTDLTSVQLPSSVIFIGEGAFNGFGLTSITYTGTMAEWRDIDKDDDWDLGTGDYVIHCTDGDIAKDE